MVLIKILTTNIFKKLDARYYARLSVHVISFNPHGNIEGRCLYIHFEERTVRSTEMPNIKTRHFLGCKP